MEVAWPASSYQVEYQIFLGKDGSTPRLYDTVKTNSWVLVPAPGHICSTFEISVRAKNACGISSSSPSLIEHMSRRP